MDRLAFTVLAIEASAKKMNISPIEMRRRLDKVGLIKSLIKNGSAIIYKITTKLWLRKINL